MYSRLLLSLFFIIFSSDAAFVNRTYQDVLNDDYKGCKLVKENIFLTKDQVNKIKRKYEFNVSALILKYNNSCNKSSIYIDSNIVRTLNQTVLFEIKNGKVLNLKIASFMEPKEYLPPTGWLNLFKKEKDEVDSLSGATISENAIKRIVKKYILVDNVLNDKN